MPNNPQDQAGTPNEPPPDPVLEADLESFPASDPPSWTGTTVGHDSTEPKPPPPPKPAKP